MRKAKINKEDILNATIQLVGDIGLENVTTKKVAAHCGISEGSVFNYYQSKKNLLTQCLYHIDQQIDNVLQQVPISPAELMPSVQGLWFTYFEYLVSHGDYAKYYRAFRHSSYYTEEVVAGQDQSFTYFSKLLRSNVPMLPFNINIMWVYIIETTLNFAIRIADGTLPYGENESENGIYFKLLMTGVTGILTP